MERITWPTVTPPIAQPTNCTVPTGGVFNPSAQLICTPIFLPIAMQFGMDPVQFGIIMLINCALGLNTPPVGTVQFVGCAIGGVTVGQVMRSIAPFYGALGLCLLLVTYVPAFSMWLPNLFLMK